MIYDLGHFTLNIFTLNIQPQTFYIKPCRRGELNLKN